MGSRARPQSRSAGDLHVGDVPGAMGVAALAGDFGFSGQSFAVRAAVLGSIGRNAATGSIRAFLRIGHKSPSSVQRAARAPANYDAGVARRDGSQALDERSSSYGGKGTRGRAESKIGVSVAAGSSTKSPFPCDRFKLKTWVFGCTDPHSALNGKMPREAAFCKAIEGGGFRRPCRIRRSGARPRSNKSHRECAA